MSANGSTVPKAAGELAEQGKGKGKATSQPASHDMMDEDDDEEDEEFDDVEEQPEEEEEDEDNLEEIDTSNILPPTRGNRSTRGKQINWAEAEQKLKDEGAKNDDEDEDEDDDFEEPAEDEEMHD